MWSDSLSTANPSGTFVDVLALSFVDCEFETLARLCQCLHAAGECELMKRRNELLERDTAHTAVSAAFFFCVIMCVCVCVCFQCALLSHRRLQRRLPGRGGAEASDSFWAPRGPPSDSWEKVTKINKRSPWKWCEAMDQTWDHTEIVLIQCPWVHPGIAARVYSSKHARDYSDNI